MHDPLDFDSGKCVDKAIETSDPKEQMMTATARQTTEIPAIRN